MDQDEKARLYKRIVHQTSQWLLLERMRLHGFWPKHEALPEPPKDEAEERAEIEAELQRLRAVQCQVVNPQKALADEQRRRWEESKSRRAARAAEKAEAAAAVKARLAAERKLHVRYAGDGVSGQLRDTAGDATLLQHHGLPLLERARDLAELLDLDMKTLRWLTYHRKGAALVHYRRYTIPKKTGGRRAISAPKPKLAAAQRAVLDRIIGLIPTSEPAHGFVPQRSIVSNASPHCGKAAVVNLDLADFFPSIDFARVRGLFRSFGYNGEVASLLALLTTEPPRVEAEALGAPVFIAIGNRVLPQGACTSPQLTNLICRRLDARLTGLAARFGFTYTRYADDLSFSSESGEYLGPLLGNVRAIVADEGFTMREDKSRIMRRGRHQEVTGLTVNERPTLPRKERKRLRAVLHNITKNGWEAENRGQHPAFKEHIRGKVAFLCSVDPHHAQAFRELLARALARS